MRSVPHPHTPRMRSALYFSFKHSPEDVTVAVRFVFEAMTHDGNGFALCQFLKEAEGEFLSVVFDGAVLAINGEAIK